MLDNIKFDYKPFLKQAYIDPIRTVTVIDDEYPTLDALVTKGREEFNSDDINRLSEIIAVSRDIKYNWLLDVYDGEEDKLSVDNVSSRLHHSDLLILDYHLDGEDDGFCQKSINIIKNLSNNRHFNIVAVHTKGYTGEKGTVNDVFTDIIVSLQAKPKLASLHQKPLKLVNNALDQWEIEQPEIRVNLINSIPKLDLLFLLKKYEIELTNGLLEHDFFDEFSSIYDEKPEDIALCKKLLIRWTCIEILKEYDDKFASETAKHFDWGKNETITWVKTEDLFLTVIGKKQTPVSEIPDKLLEAMEDWRPHPHKLILSKLRNEIESKGVSASSNILNKKYLQAAWLKDLLKAENNSEIQTAAWGTVSKLWEELATEIKYDLGTFTANLVNQIKTLETDKQSALNYFVDTKVMENEVEQVLHANCFSCSRTITTHHIITGHILEINRSYWLCLTPICDLVPGQKNISHNPKIQDVDPFDQLIPVTLVQMYDAKEALKSTRDSMIKSLKITSENIPSFSDEDLMVQLLEHSTSNNMIFIKPNKDSDEIRILSFTVGIDGKANPKAKDFYVEKQGVFNIEDRKLKLYSAQPCDKGLELKITPLEGTVVAELRYEYALNLLGKLGVSKSRVGLDFIN
ncbi:response regulator receiver domain [Shewanella sp. SACH]|uniref:response regulator receiver domain n=1 Tax=Shewanella sp. SACH TaxID=1873135 RepID=UPI000A944E67|nr:response regulator receiver domain [Shewanella sp. SACH]